MWSAVNVLTKSPKIWHITKREFLQLNCVHSDQEIWQWCCCWDINSVSASLPCYLSKGPMKGVFLDFYLSTFFGVCKFKNPSGMRVIVFLTSDIFFQNWITTLKMQQKNVEKFFCFRDNCNWRCCNKLSLLRKEYLSSAVNVLPNSPKTLHITKRHFFQLNCFHSDQSIW